MVLKPLLTWPSQVLRPNETTEKSEEFPLVKIPLHTESTENNPAQIEL